MAYAKAKGLTLFPFVSPPTRTTFESGELVPYDAATSPPPPLGIVHYYTSPTKSDAVYFSERDIKRDDPALVTVVEQLGEKADGPCAKLRVIEIPDNIEFEIQEYDGNEHIAERHRRWG